jgi:hypothetical protein
LSFLDFSYELCERYEDQECKDLIHGQSKSCFLGLLFATVAGRVLRLFVLAALAYKAIYLGTQRTDFFLLAKKVFDKEEFVTFFDGGSAPCARGLPFADHCSLLDAMVIRRPPAI